MPTFDVAHVTTAHPAIDARIFYKEAVTASECGFRVAVVGPHAAPETRQGVTIVPIPKPRARLVRRLLGPLHALQAVRRTGARVVHFHDPEFIPAALVLKLMGRRVVWDIHEFYSEIQSLRVPRGPARSFVRWLVSAFIERGPCAVFDRAVFPTHALREAIAPGARSVALVNLLPSALLPEQLPQPHAPEYDVVFVGSISPFRAGPLMEMMAAILKRRPGAKLLLLGIPEATRTWMQAEAPSQEVLDALTFHGRVPHTEVYSIIASAKVGFNYHPMERRFQVALPMKVYEYMACGLPVVCSRFPELETQFRSGEEIVFVDGDRPDAYAEAILRLLDDQAERTRIAQAALAALRSRVNWDMSEKPKVRRLYEELLHAG